MKKILAVVAVLCVVCVAGSAFAQQEGQPKKRLDQRMMPRFAQSMPAQQPGQFRPCRCGEARGAEFDGRGPRGAEFDGRGPREHRGLQFAPDMPEEIKAKVVEAAKLHIDLDAALSAKPIDKAKALEVFGQLQKTEQEIEAWKFAKKIEMIEAFRAKKVHPALREPKPAPKAPAPVPEAPAPEATAE